jgi:hypothetical protein
LKLIPEEKHKRIIDHPEFGLKSITTVAVWMEAIELGSASIPYKTLMEAH